MEPKATLAILALAVVVLVSGCTQTDTSNTGITDTGGTGGGATPSEQDRFIDAQVELACFLATGGAEAVMDTAAMESIAAKHGFTTTQLNNLGPKYDTPEVKLALEAGMRQNCPEALP